MTHRSKWHQRQHLIRLTRRAAMANLAQGGTGGTAYRLYLFLVDKATTGRIEPRVTPIAKQCVRVRSYLVLRDIGWRPVKAAA